MVETKRVKCPGSQVILHGKVNEKPLKIIIDLEENQELYLLKTMDNPVNQIRDTVLIRQDGRNPGFHLTMEIS